MAEDIGPQNARVVHPTVEELLPTPEARERFKKTLAELEAARIRRNALDKLAAEAQAMGEYE